MFLNLLHNAIMVLSPGQDSVVTFLLLLPPDPQSHPLTNFSLRLFRVFFCCFVCLFSREGHSLWQELCAHKFSLVVLLPLVLMCAGVISFVE